MLKSSDAGFFSHHFLLLNLLTHAFFFNDHFSPFNDFCISFWFKFYFDAFALCLQQLFSVYLHFPIMSLFNLLFLRLLSHSILGVYLTACD